MVMLRPRQHVLSTKLLRYGRLVCAADARRLLYFRGCD